MKGFIQFLFVAIIFSAVSSTLFSTSSHADIYKWTDDDGNAHFTDNKRADMPEDKAQPVEVAPVNLIEKNAEYDKATKAFLNEKDRERALENAKLARQKPRKFAASSTDDDPEEKQKKLPRGRKHKSKAVKIKAVKNSMGSDSKNKQRAHHKG